MKWKWITIIILIFQLFLILLLYNSYQRFNTEVCSVYWDEECTGFDISDKICSCESGEYVTTSDMIRKRNEELRMEWEDINEETRRQWEEELKANTLFVKENLLKA